MRRDKFVSTDSAALAQLNAAEIELRSENELIWDELNHFQYTGLILGKHPIFLRNKLVDEVNAMTPLQLVQMMKNLPTYRSKVQKHLRKEGVSDDYILKQRSLLEKYDRMEELIMTKLNK